MALFAQFDKCVTLSKRESSFTDEKNGTTNRFRYVTGFDAVSGSVFSDLQISPDSPISIDDVIENGVYDCQFNYSVVKDAKNAQRLTSVKLVQLIGVIEIKSKK